MAVTQGSFPVIKCSAQADVIDSDSVPGGIVNVNYAMWVSKGATAGDDLLVKDGDGNTIIEDVADGAYFSKIYVLKHPFADITITTMDSGTFYIVKESPKGWNA